MERTSQSAARHRPLSRLVVAAAILAFAAAALALLSSFGTRWDWWHFRTGFTMLRWAAYAGLAVAVLSLIAIFRAGGKAGRRGMPLAILAFIVAAATFVIPWQVQRLGQRVPPIHDITTDTENPPEFVDVVPLRADAPNPVEYGGSEVAAQQREAYPEVAPLRIDMPPDSAFREALDAAGAMGWEIVSAESAEGRIEATDVTFWYGFEDDVVVRLSPENDHTRLDVRSVSRVGGGDLGVNARRVLEYLDEVRKRVQP